MISQGMFLKSRVSWLPPGWLAPISVLWNSTVTSGVDGLTIPKKVIFKVLFHAKQRRDLNKPRQALTHPPPAFFKYWLEHWLPAPVPTLSYL